MPALRDSVTFAPIDCVTPRPPPRSILALILRWFDSSADPATQADSGADRIDWPRTVPFIALHLACFGVFFVGVSATAITVAVALYALRMFAMTAFYHRYFAHKAFRASRGVQFAGAVMGASCAQRGPLWWAAHHRNHHRFADTEHDLHSPRRGFLRSHMGWFLSRRAFRTNFAAIADFARFPELRLLDRFDVVVPALLATVLYVLGTWLHASYPHLGTDGPQMLVWGFFVSTVVLFHATVTINSIAHRYGRRRFATRDDSRNNWLLALVTFGEGWHNNHHFFPGSARQGFRWWELDLTWHGLRVLESVGLVRDLKPVPLWVLARMDHR